MNELSAKRVLKEVKEVLEAHNIEYWLNFGALLGAVREGKFISYDNDIELNAWAHNVTEQQMKSVSKGLCQRGFSVYYSTLTDYVSIWKNNINVAFSMYTLKGDKAERPHEHVYGPGKNALIGKYIYWLSEIFAISRSGKINTETILGLKRIGKLLLVTFSNILPGNFRRKIAISLRFMSIKIGGEYGKTRIPARFYLRLRDLRFYNMNFKVPSEVEEYLKFIYGPKWRVPTKNWSFYDMNNRSVTGIEIIDELWNYA